MKQKKKTNESMTWEAVNDPNQTQLKVGDPRYFRKYKEARLR